MSPAPLKRHLAAIVAADVVGYSRLMGADEKGTFEALKAHRKELIDPLIAAYKGHIVKTMGDGLLLSFPSVVEALSCAVAVQHGMAKRNQGIPADGRIEFRIGVHIGDVIVEKTTCSATASISRHASSSLRRREASACPRTSTAGPRQARYSHRRRRQNLKNISSPVRTYRIEASVAAATGRYGFPTSRNGEDRSWRWQGLQ